MEKTRTIKIGDIYRLFKKLQKKKLMHKKAYLILKYDGSLQTFKVYPITKDMVVIGRGCRNLEHQQKLDITVHDTYVSCNPKYNRIPPGHAMILKDRRDRYWILDLASTNGTFVNEKRIFQKVQLLDGDKIRLGPRTTFKFVLRWEFQPRIECSN